MCLNKPGVCYCGLWQSGSGAVSALPAFQVNDKFSLNQDEAWYTLSIELQSPIDMVVLQVYNSF